MKRCPRAGLVGLIGFLVVLAGAGRLDAQKSKEPKEAVVQGKAISAWVKDLEGKDVLARVRAVNALMQAGPEARGATKTLLAIAADKDAGLVQPVAAVALSRIGADALPVLEKSLADPSASVRIAAAGAIGMLGDAARPALPALSAALKDSQPSVRLAVVAALGRIGPLARPVMPGLRTALGDDSPAVRVEAAAANWLVGKESKGLDVLRKALGDTSADVVLRAIQGLGDMGTAAAPAAADLAKLLAGGEVTRRLAAAEALYRINKDAKAVETVLAATETPAETRKAAIASLGTMVAEEKALARLVALLADKDPELRREAACALTSPGAMLTEARTALEAALGDADPGVRWWSALALARSALDVRKREEDILRVLRLPLMRIGETEPPAELLEVQGVNRAGPALAEVLRSRGTRLQIEAARLLAAAGIDARPARAELLEAMAAEDKSLRRAVAEALASLNSDALPDIIKQLGNADGPRRETAARAVGLMGIQARGALTGLNRLLKDAEAPVRGQTALALWNIDGQAETALLMLNAILKDVDNADRWEAIEGVGIIGVDARPSIRGLTEVVVNMLKDRDIRVRVQAAKWLWRRTRQAKAVVPLLRDAVTDRDLPARLVAIETLGEMPVEEKLLPLLLGGLEDRDIGVRLATMEALARGGAAAVPGLVEVLKTKSGRTRLGVLRVLGMIGPAATKAVEAIEEVKKSSESEAALKEAIAETLRAIGPAKKGS